MTLGKVLDIAADEAQRGCYWLVLSKQRSTDIVGGELCLGFEVMPMEQQQFNQVRVCSTLLCWRVSSIRQQLPRCQPYSRHSMFLATQPLRPVVRSPHMGHMGHACAAPLCR